MYTLPIKYRMKITLTLLSMSWVNCSSILLNVSAGTSLKSDDTIWNSSFAALFLSWNNVIEVNWLNWILEFNSSGIKCQILIYGLPLQFLTWGLESSAVFVEAALSFWFIYFVLRFNTIFFDDDFYKLLIHNTFPSPQIYKILRAVQTSLFRAKSAFKSLISGFGMS